MYAGNPAKVKSKKLVWLIAMTAPPVAGRFSTPVTVNLSPCIFQIRRAAWMTVPYTGSTSARLVLVCSAPGEKVPVPPVVREIAAGREMTPVWINEFGGVAFPIDPELSS